MNNTVTFGTWTPEGLVNVRIIKQADIAECPHLIMVPNHYRDNGTCKCDDPTEQAMMIRDWGYSRKDFLKVRKQKTKGT